MIIIYNVGHDRTDTNCSDHTEMDTGHHWSLWTDPFSPGHLRRSKDLVGMLSISCPGTVPTLVLVSLCLHQSLFIVSIHVSLDVLIISVSNIQIVVVKVCGLNHKYVTSVQLPCCMTHDDTSCHQACVSACHMSVNKHWHHFPWLVDRHVVNAAFSWWVRGNGGHLTCNLDNLVVGDKIRCLYH